MSYSSSFTPYGFTWGPANVYRMASTPKHGVFLIVESRRHEVQIRVTPSGLIRVSKVAKKPKEAT